MAMLSTADPALAPHALAGPSPTDPVARLPAALAQLLFLLLPAHERMRCREVSRAWRAALADRGCWRVLRFSGCEDLPRVRDDPRGLDHLIRAAGRAAGGAAEEIDARGLRCDYGVIATTLKRVAEANGRSLRVLRISGTAYFLRAEDEDAGASVAPWVDPRIFPQLQELEADVTAESVGAARQLLGDARQPDGRFKALRVRVLRIGGGDASAGGGAHETPEKQREAAESLVALLQTAAPGHPSLTGLDLEDMPLLHPGLIDLVADAAVSCRLESLRLSGPHIDHTCLPALSRALRCGRLRSLVLWHESVFSDGARVLDGPRDAHAELCAALRGSRLESLTLTGMRLWADPDNGRALLAALTAHPTLRSLDVSWNKPAHLLESDPRGAASKAAAAEAIAALLEANAPALQSLRAERCRLAGEHLERILGALRGNAHLTALECEQGAGARGVDEAFAERVVLPLVRANTTLRRLKWGSFPRGAAGEEIRKVMEARVG